MFDRHDLIDLADSLLSVEGADEAHVRCAISRAYYAVFNLNHARVVARRRIVASPESPHSAVWRELSARGSAAEQRLARGAKRLKDARIDADYKAEIASTFRDATYWVSLARRLMQETDALP